TIPVAGENGRPARSAQCAELLETLGFRQTRIVVNLQQASEGQPIPLLRKRAEPLRPNPKANVFLPAFVVPGQQWPRRIRLRRAQPSDFRAGSPGGDRTLNRQSSHTRTHCSARNVDESQSAWTR